jgi:hypothetical protein
MKNLVKNNNARWRTLPSNCPPGILSATPVDIAAGTNKVMYNCGTSNSAALISHEGAICYEILNNIFFDEIGTNVPGEYAALLIKAMLAHGAEWNDAAEVIRDALNLSGRAADDIHKWLGYGVPDISRVKECAQNRITLIGYGALMCGAAHLYKLPLPFDLYTQRIYRCLTGTLAYFTPIIATRQKYRKAQLWYTIEDDGKRLVPDRKDVDDKAATRGTLQHEKYISDNAILWGEDDILKIRVSCRGDAEDKFTELIPYALFVTFEVKEDIGIDVYSKVKTRVKQAVPITNI